MLAIRAMKVLLCAQRTLTPAELMAAVTIDPLTNEPLISSVSDLLDACCNMVFLDEEFNTFRFAHLSVREYLESKENFGQQDIHLLALNRCLGALLYNSKTMGATRVPNSSEAKFIDVKNQTLQRYAMRSWPLHCQLVPGDQVEASPNLRLFIDTQGDFKDVSSEWLDANLSRLSNYHGYTVPKESGQPLMLVASIYGLASIFRRLMPLESVPGNVEQYITIAAERGHLNIVEILLNRQDSQYRLGEKNEFIGCKALRAAVKHTSTSHGAIAKALVNHGVNIHYCGDPKTIQTFQTLAEDTSQGDPILRPDTDDCDTKNALLYAVKNDDEELVQLLLEHGADPNSAAWSFDYWSSPGVSKNALDYASSTGVINR
jgi:hypothetical protein